MVKSAQISVATDPVVLADGGGDTCRVFVLNKGSSSVYLGGESNDVQIVALTGGPTGGTFTLTLDAEETGAIDFDATAADVQAALEDLLGIQPGDVYVSGPDLPAGFMRIEFVGSYAGQDVAEMTADGGNLAGGSSAGVSVSTAQEGGVSSSTGFELAQNASVWFDLGAGDRLVGISSGTATCHVLLTSA